MKPMAAYKAASRKRLGRQGIWDAIRATAPALFTALQIQAETGIPATTVREYLTGLQAAGYLAQSKVKPFTYWLTRDVGVEAPRVDKTGNLIAKGSAQEQMWRAMKIMGGDWSHLDLAVAASLENSPVREDEAEAYIHSLALAGYLRQVGNDKTSPKRYRYIQQKSSGPLAPICTRVRVVFDPNTGEIVWHQQVES